MSISVDISQDLDSQLRDEAASLGVEPSAYVENALKEHLARSARSDASERADSEAKLLRRINTGPSENFWEQYNSLSEKSRAELLTPTEHAELVRLSDQLERVNLEQMEALVELANVRETPLEQLMRDLGIPSTSNG